MLDPKFENVAFGERSPIRWIHRMSKDLGDDHGWHFHPEFELTWFIASVGTRYVGDSVERYQAGDLILAGAGLPHCWRNDPDSHAEWISVQFSPDHIGSALELPEASKIATLLHVARFGLSFDAYTAKAAGPLLSRMQYCQGLISILRLLEVLHVLADAKFRQLTSAEFGSHRPVDEEMLARLDVVMRYIAQHFRGAVRQGDLADHLGMTPQALSKFVRTATGETFVRLVKKARINEAARMLAHGDERITRVALACGYQHSSHFDQHFHELKHATPSEYRRRMRMFLEKGRNATGN